MFTSSISDYIVVHVFLVEEADGMLLQTEALFDEHAEDDQSLHAARSQRKRSRHGRKFLFYSLERIFTLRKRSLGQGNIFRSVCQEFCPQGRCLVLGVGAWSLGGCLVLGFRSTPTTKGEVEGDLVQATPKREVEGDLVQAHTQGGS